MLESSNIIAPYYQAIIDASYAENIKRRMRVEAKLMEDVPGYEPMPTNYYHQNWTEPKNNEI